MNLFIDDIRFPEQANPPVDTGLVWTIARDYVEAMNLIQEHKPQRIAFDHDLSMDHYAGRFGGEKTGYDVAKDLIELDMNEPEAGYITKDFIFTCHSANPDGKRNILNLLARYYREKFIINPKKEIAHV